MTYEFQNTLHRNAREMHEAIASEWLSAGGANTEALQHETLEEYSDAEMADEAIRGWNLADEWAVERDFSRDMLIEAFASLRKEMTK